MTKRDYELIAEAIREAADRVRKERPINREINVTIAYAFVDALKSTNARFDADRFVDACKG